MAKLSLPAIRSRRAEEAYRCFSHVPFPHGSEKKHTETGRLDPSRFSSDVPKICKLIFNPFTDAADILGCGTRMEALSCSLICALLVNPSADEPSFHDQIVQYERVIDQIRFTKKKLRPQRAIILFQRKVASIAEGSEENTSYEACRARLEEHELSVDQKNLLKFGPLDLDGHEAIHAAFATIASSRILRGALTSGEDSDGSQTSEAPPCYGVEVEGEYFARKMDEEPVWIAKLSSTNDVLELIPEAEGGLEQVRLSPSEATMGTLESKYSGSRKDWLSPMEKGAA